MRRARVAWFTLGIVVLALVLLVAAWMLAGSNWAEDRVARFVEGRANGLLVGQLRIGRLRGSVLGGELLLSDVELVGADGPVVTVDEMTVRFQPWSFTSGHYQIDDVTLTRPVVSLRESTEGWNVARLLRSSAEPAGEAAIQSLSIAHLEVRDGVVLVDRVNAASREFDSIGLRAALGYDGRSLTIDLDQGAFRDAVSAAEVGDVSARVERGVDGWSVDSLSAATALSRFSGRWSSTGSGQFTAEPLALRELEPLFGAIGPDPEAVATLAVSGTPADFTVDWTAESDAGRAAGQWTGAWSDGRLTLAGPTQGQGLDLARLLQDDRFDEVLSPEGRVELALPGARLDGATGSFDLRAPRVSFGGYRAAGVIARGNWANGRLDVDASANAYGAALTTTARWNQGDASLRAQGRYRDLDVRRLPSALGVPAAQTALAGEYTLEGGTNGWEFQTTMAESFVEGATVEAGSTASLSTGDAVPAYSFDGALRGVDLARLAALGPEPPVSTVEGLIGGTLSLEGRGTSLGELVGTAQVTLRDSVIAGITIDQLGADVGVSDGQLVVEADVAARGVSDRALRASAPGVFTASGTASVLATVELGDGTARVDWNAVRATGTVAFTEGTVYGVSFDRLDADVRLDRGRVIVTTLELEGPRGRATGSGAVIVAGGGLSNFDYSIQLDDLTRLDPIAGHSLAGSLEVSGTVSGALEALASAGRMQVANLEIGDLTVQSLEIDHFEVTLPALDLAQLGGTVTVSAAFVTWRRVPVDRADLVVGYANGRLDINADLVEGARRLGLTGTIDPLASNPRFIVRRLDLAADGAVWQLPASTEAAIAYSSDRLDVQGLELTNGETRVVVEGVIGIDQPIDGSRLALRAERVRLEDVNRFLAGTRALVGEAEVAAVMTGTLRAPDATLDVRIGAGAVDGVAFRELTGTAQLVGRRLDIDGAFEAGPAGRFSVHGTMPLVLGGETTEPVPAYDLRVQSEGIDLGVFTPMMPAFDDVAGRVTVGLHISGPADAPDVGGLAALEDVSFRLPATGVAYRRMNGQLSIQRRDLIVHDLTFEDADGHVGRVQGGLEVAVDGPPTGFDLRITADGLHVLDNRDGEIAVNLEMQMMGDLSTPLLVGTVRVTRGLIEASDLLNRLSRAQDPPGFVPPGMTREEAEANQTSLDRMSVSITLDLPGNVVVRGRDLRTGGGPIGLGDVNVTVGGALSISKETGEEVDLRGRLDVTRGQYQFQGRAFTIQRGSGVQFRGSPTNPTLDFVADRVISGVTAEVRLRGTMEEPEITLSSRPPLDEGDILALIVFGQAMNQLQATERVSLAARAGAIAASSIANPLTDSVARALNLDEFQFRPGEGVSGAGTLTIGRQLNDRLFVGFRHDFGAADASQVTFEYRLSEYLLVLTSLAQGGDRSHGTQRAEAAGIDLIIRIRR